MGSRKWLMVALVVCGLATACQDYNTNLSVQTASSILTFVSPSQASVGGQGFTITANGTGFTTGAEIQWNGVALVTTLVSSIQLTAPVPASNLTSSGVVQISVRIPGSAQSPTQNIYATTTTEVSNVVLFTVSNAPSAPPAITSLSPNSAPYCGNTSDFALTVNGTGFTSDSVVNWNGSQPVPHSTQMVSSTQLTAPILARDTVGPSPATVTVSNSSGTSNALQFTISSNTPTLPAPTLAFFAGNPPTIPQSPSSTSAPAGSAALPLEIDARPPATSFSACSVVQWVAGGVTTALPTLYTSTPNSTTGSPANLTTTIPASLLASTGTANIRISTPGQPVSATVPFTITQAQPPSISSITAPGTTNPVTSVHGCNPASVNLQVNGSNFVPSSVVNWNGQPRPTTFVQPPAPSGSTTPSAPYLTVIIPNTDLQTQSTAAITVSNGSLVSNSVSFSVTAPASSLPAPTVTSLTPSSAMAEGGSSTFSLIVTGTDFQPCSQILWGTGTSQLKPTTSYLNSTQLSALISGGLTSVGPVPVTVSTPAPGGGMSTPVNFTVSALGIDKAFVDGDASQTPSTPYCSASVVTLLDVTAASGTTFTPDTVVNWNGSPRPTTFVSATELQAAITYADIAMPGSVSVTVSNSASISASFSFGLTPPASLPVPSISSLSPSNAVAGGPAFTLSVYGWNMLPCSTVQWNNTAPTTTFTSPNGLTASISAADIAAAAIDQVTVNTPPPSGCTPSTTVTCGGTSNSSAFTVHTPVAGVVRPAASIQATGTEVTTGAAPLLALHLMSSNQRYAVHVLASTDGITEVAGSTQNIFVQDTCAGAPAGCVPSEKLVSVGVGGNPSDDNSFSPSISADGRYVAFLSSARNLVDGDTNGVTDVFVRDTCAGAAAGCAPSTQRVSVANDGTQAGGPSTSATVSADGRYVTFESSANNLGSPSASPSSPGFFLRDTCAGAGAACVPSTATLQ